MPSSRDVFNGGKYSLGTVCVCAYVCAYVILIGVYSYAMVSGRCGRVSWPPKNPPSNCSQLIHTHPNKSPPPLFFIPSHHIYVDSGATGVAAAAVLASGLALLIVTGFMVSASQVRASSRPFPVLATVGKILLDFSLMSSRPSC